MPRLLLLAAVLIWGWTFVATKVCLQYMGPLQLVGCRFLLASPLLYLLARWKRVRLSGRGHRRSLAIGAAVFSGHFLLQATALQFTTATNTGWIIAVAPLVIVIMAAGVLGEPIQRGTWIGIVTATVGVVLLISRGDLASLNWLSSVGDWMALASTFSWAVYTIVTRDASREVHPIRVTLTVVLPLAVVALVQMLFNLAWAPLSQLPGEAMAALLFLALGGVAVGQWFWLEGVAKLGAARAGLFLYLEPIATTALAVPYLDEPFGWTVVVGGFLVLLGVFVAERP